MSKSFICQGKSPRIIPLLLSFSGKALFLNVLKKRIYKNWRGVRGEPCSYERFYVPVELSAVGCRRRMNPLLRYIDHKIMTIKLTFFDACVRLARAYYKNVNCHWHFVGRCTFAIDSSLAITYGRL